MDPSGKKIVVVGSGNSAHDIRAGLPRERSAGYSDPTGSTYVLGQAGLPLLPENAFVDDDSCVHT
jgi:hypothetical protein